jgi:hypothetical protein
VRLTAPVVGRGDKSDCPWPSATKRRYQEMANLRRASNNVGVVRVNNSGIMTGKTVKIFFNTDALSQAKAHAGIE